MALRPERELEERIATLRPTSWAGLVYRILPNSVDPREPTVRGARWNRRGVRTIYTSLEEETALAEVRHHLRGEPHRLVKGHRVHRIRVAARALLDLRDPEARSLLEVNTAIAGEDYELSQRIGAGAVLLKHDGLLVPSARETNGTNLVIFLDRVEAASGEVTPLDWRDIDLAIVRQDLRAESGERA